MEQEQLNKKLVLVVGGMLFDESCVMVRKTTPQDRLRVLTENEAAGAASRDEIPEIWSRFGALYHSLVIEGATKFISAQSLVMNPKRKEWCPGERPAANTPAGQLTLLCWLEEPAAPPTGS